MYPDYKTRSGKGRSRSKSQKFTTTSPSVRIKKLKGRNASNPNNAVDHSDMKRNLKDSFKTEYLY